jgi:hypothetical protein
MPAPVPNDFFLPAASAVFKLATYCRGESKQQAHSASKAPDRQQVNRATTEFTVAACAAQRNATHDRGNSRLRQRNKHLQLHHG